ncbi:MAG: rod shape-determining protein MreD [Acidobacteria bacterium]|nr:rod shape-determining protein MreD [Acidobacteriota bacterium]
MRIAGIAAALVVALAFQTTLAHLLSGTRVSVDLVLVLVVYTSLLLGPTAGLLIGSAAGLAQDALSGGVIGVGGFAKSLLGFVVGVLGTRFIVANALPRFVVFFVGSLAHGVVFFGLYWLIDPPGIGWPYTEALLQAAMNGVIGVSAFVLAERGPEMISRRRARRAYLGRRVR